MCNMITAVGGDGMECNGALGLYEYIGNVPSSEIGDVLTETEVKTIYDAIKYLA